MKTNKMLLRTIVAVALIVLSFTSCKKDFLDINKDPNNPAEADVQVLLPSAEAAIAVPIGNNFQVFGGMYAQFWTQATNSTQYKSYEQYNPSADDFDRPWKALYADALQDLNSIISKATAEKKTNYVACAKILQAYTYQLLTDNFGDIPFKETLQGESGNYSPHFDSQKNVYDGIISLLKDGISMIDENTDVTPGSDDLLLKGDMAQWRKFGNTLLLRVYLRLSEVDQAKAQAGIVALNDSAAEFLSEGENVQINYSSQGGNTNPLNAEMVGLNNTQNIVASATAVDYLNANNDFRVDAFYNPPPSGVQTGIPQGAYNLPVGSAVSFPSDLTGANTSTAADADESALAPVKFMTGSESLFLQSEAAARGWLVSGDEQDLYDRGITESFLTYADYLGVTATDASDYYTQDSIAYPIGGTLQQKLRAIITQKWISMCGTQNDEAWIEWRRTDYPDFFTVSANSNIGGGRFPERLFYPSTELTRNSNFPGQKLIYDKVWWDVH